MTEDESLRLTQINERMQFSNTNLALTPDKLDKNSSKRNTFKMLANSMLGKFSQKSNYPDILYVRSKKDMDETFCNEEIVDILPISDDICELQVESVNKSPKRNTNCIIGAFITALARVKLHSEMCKLQQTGFRLFYVDTDSIIFSGKRSAKIPLTCSPCLGDFKKELGPETQIKAFSCLGRKNYSIAYSSREREESIIKISGLTLSSKIVADCLSVTKLEKFLKDRQNNSYAETSVPQFRNFACKDENTVTKKILNIRINNVLDIQRIVPADITADTFPFGYIE